MELTAFVRGEVTAVSTLHRTISRMSDATRDEILQLIEAWQSALLRQAEVLDLDLKPVLALIDSAIEQGVRRGTDE